MIIKMNKGSGSRNTDYLSAAHRLRGRSLDQDLYQKWKILLIGEETDFFLPREVRNQLENKRYQLMNYYKKLDKKNLNNKYQNTESYV